MRPFLKPSPAARTRRPASAAHRPTMLAVAIMCVSIAAADSNPQSGPITSTVFRDFERSRITIEIESAMTDQAASFPKNRLLAHRRIEEVLPSVALRSALEITLDSHRTVMDRVRDDPNLFAELVEFTRSPILDVSWMNSELTAVKSRYHLPFYGSDGIASLFVSHSRPIPTSRFLGFYPSRDFTGVIIYAKGTYGLWGHEDRVAVKPALFPRILDEQLNIVAAREMIDPEHIRRWGIVEYSTSADERDHLTRVGVVPFRTMAQAVFGENETDIVIATRAARALLSRSSNGGLIREGRIVIVIDQPPEADR